jgi:spermidine synthase
MFHYRFISLATDNQIRQILNLYREAGWWSEKYDFTEKMDQIVKGSHCFMISLNEKEIVGCGRAISDGVSDAYIQDVTVKKKYENRGIGSRIVEEIIDRLLADEISWIGLIAENRTTQFYERLGLEPMKNATPMRIDTPWT